MSGARYRACERGMNSEAIRIANERLWAAHPELKGRELTLGPEDAALREEWWKYYHEAENAKPPPPAVEPEPVPPPPEPAPPVQTCPPPPTPVITDDCKEIAKHVQEGDIVLRGERGQQESDFLAAVSKCNYSHAGIVARNEKGELVIVDAYPGRGADGGNSNAVKAISVEDFFCSPEYGATHGLVTRPKDCEAAKKAAAWAMEQTKDSGYEFDLFDPWSSDPKKLYCADFVYQAYQDAGTDMVPEKMDFLSPENKENTLDAARDYEGWYAHLATDSKIEEKLLEQSGGTSEYITPCQVAVNDNTNTVLTYDSGKTTPSSGGKKD